MLRELVDKTWRGRVESIECSTSIRVVILLIVAQQPTLYSLDLVVIIVSKIVDNKAVGVATHV